MKNLNVLSNRKMTKIIHFKTYVINLFYKYSQYLGLRIHLLNPLYRPHRNLQHPLQPFFLAIRKHLLTELVETVPHEMVNQSVISGEWIDFSTNSCGSFS